MKYLRVKSSISKTASTSGITINTNNTNYTNTTKLPDNWTLEFFLKSTIDKSSITKDLSLFDFMIYETSESSAVTSCIRIYVPVSNPNNYIFKIGEDEKIIPESILYRDWDHIAIVWAIDYSVIIYINGNPITGINMSELSFKNYYKFNKFLFTTHKDPNIVNFAGIKVYSSIKYNKSGFSITYPSSIISNIPIIPGNDGKSVEFINNNSDEDKNILVVTDPEIITQIEENEDKEIFRMNFDNSGDILDEVYKRYINKTAGATYTSNSIEIVELDDEINYELYDVKYRFSQMLKIKSDFIISIDTGLGSFTNNGVSIDLLCRQTDASSLSNVSLLSFYNATSSNSIAYINSAGTGLSNAVINNISTYATVTHTATNSISRTRVTAYSNKFIHYLTNLKCTTVSSSDNTIYRRKINGVESLNSNTLNTAWNINTPFNPTSFKITTNMGSSTTRIFLWFRAGDYFKLFRISQTNLFGGSFDPSFYLFGPLVINNIAIESNNNDKTSSSTNIQLLYPANNSSTNIYERSHSNDFIHNKKYYFIMESTSTTDIKFTNEFSGTGYPSAYTSYPAVTTTSQNRDRNLIKFRCPYPVYAPWIFECWIYLKTNNASSTNYYDILYLSGLQYGFIGLKIAPLTGDCTVCYDKLNKYSSNKYTMETIQINPNQNNSTYAEQILLKDNITLELNKWNHIAITCSMSAHNTYGITNGTLKVIINNKVITSITKFHLAYLHRIFLFTKSLTSELIPSYTGVKVEYSTDLTPKESFNITTTV